jgi:V/A-type H+/Na+-transporting ATPase subunit E
MTSELVAILEREASAEIERVLAEARTQAEQLLAAARQDAQAYLAEQQRHLDAERAAAATRAQSAAQVKAAALVLQTKDRAIADVFARAEAELAQVQQDKVRYGAILRGLIKEAAAALTGRFRVEVNPGDLEIARQAVRDLNLDADVVASDDVRGGARLSSGDGRLVVENTLQSRLARVKTIVASEAAALLWGQ